MIARRPIPAFLVALALLGLPGATQAASEPLRVATLLPFAEEALAQAPSQHFEVVASVRRELHEPVAQELVDLGNPHSPSFENLALARAELVIGDRMIHAHVAPRVEATGIEVMLIDTSSADATLDALLAVGLRVQAGPELDRAVARARTELAKTRLDQTRKVLALFGTPGRFYAVTERSWLGSLLSGVGYENVAPPGQERMPGFVVVSDEVLAMVEPDLVLIVAHGDPDKIRTDLERRAGEGGAWASMRDAELGIHVLDPQLFAAQPGLTLPAAAAALVRYGAPSPVAESSAR